MHGKATGKIPNKLIEGGILWSEDDLTHDFLCVPEDFTFGGGVFEDDVCVPAGADLTIEWVNPIEKKLVPES